MGSQQAAGAGLLYEAGIKICDPELAGLAIERDEFHGAWNYRIKPRAR